VEAILGIQALREGVLPQTLNTDPLDPEIDIPVTAKPVHLVKSSSDFYMLKNCFGFGGHNISIILSGKCKNS